jgi:Tfp pilus assembly protein PilF
MCRLKMKDRSGAFDALSQALEMDPEHDQARVVLESV